MNLLYIICIVVLFIFSFELFAIYYVVPVDKYDKDEHVEHKTNVNIDDEII